MTRPLSQKLIPAQSKRAYDRRRLHPSDEEACKHDDKSEGIDWDEILETTEDDYLAGRHAFSTKNYPDRETAMKALEQWLQSISHRVFSRETASTSGRVAAG